MSRPKHKSILQTEKECYVSRKHLGLCATGGLQIHHIYAGKNRKISDDNGFWVYLLPMFHTGLTFAVHGRDGAALDLELKQDCQRKFEETHTREEFMNLIGRNYL